MKYAPLEFFLGVTVILVIAIIAGKPLRRRGSPQGPTRRYIALGAVLFVVAGLIYTFPPHNVVIAVLVLVLGTMFFTFGIAILGGGYFGYLGAAASAMAAVPFLMTPTPLGLAHVGKTLNCRVHNYRNREVWDFTADCPNGKSYDFRSDYGREFPGGGVQVRIDPHGMLQPRCVGQQHLTLDIVMSVLGLLGASGIVAAAAWNRRRLNGQVDHVVKPGFSSGP
ncbi:hypothetical protein EV651_110152 [Kribbella sp. VKM Ac-2571]|uniref:hypothetical protein n=1 Tax=Kribbella sp. VKM Ac-2571 TaxID=2512222 RepID=UPI001061828F|nr:hypothetical protein [Kribbella sp. VKM Ac-2571]TDO58118.1 hypothetical protein EV651_110152 [Kribbella sp. VKM Ac-2571]